MRELNVGGVPRGEDYFGREDLIENLWARLKRDNVLLVAPRRFGKTGAMYRLLDEPRAPFHPLYINVEHIMSAADFMVEFLAALFRDHHFSRVINKLREETKGLGRFLRNLPESIDVGGIKVILREDTDVSQQWISYGERVMAMLAKDKPHLLLLIDEFAIMIDNIAQRSPEEAERFLRWFRAIRTSPETKARFVFGGSINLIATLDAMKLVDTVNDLSVEKLKPFDAKTAKRFVETIFASRRAKLAPKVRDTILELVGAPIPYLLSVLLTAIFDRQRATRKKVSMEMVEAAFQDDLLGGATAAVFRHYRSRIDQYYPDLEGRAAKAILGILSRSESPVRRDTLYQIFLKTGNLQPDQKTQEDFLRLMYKLDNDFYVVSQDDTFAFFSRVLQLWWKTHYGFQSE